MPLPTGLKRLRAVWQRDIWLAAHARDRSLRSRLYAFLRIASITISGLQEIHVAVRAAALSYSSLLSLGPLVALVVLISGFALGGRDPALLAQNLNHLVGVIAPPVAQYQQASLDDPDENAAGPAQATTAAAARTADPAFVKLINNFVAHSRSGTAGAVGLLTLVLIVIQLFTTVENAFNDIWGVRRGRSWVTRIVFYWTAITLGAVLFFASLTLFSAGFFLSMFSQLPFGAHLRQFFLWVLPFSSVLLIVVVLALFYRLVPNTRVRWKAAFIGACCVTVLLFLNNYLAFLYLRQVYLQKSLYGSLGIVPILMIGLYIFWLFVLVGGQVTYAVQNVHYRSSRADWQHINETTREGLSLLVLVLIARRFKACGPACSTTELSRLLRMPTQILNESLNRLCDLGLVVELPPGEGGDASDHRYQPARPLGKITLVQFKRLFEAYGESPIGEMLGGIDPILQRYQENLAAHLPRSLGEKSLDELIDECPLPATGVPSA